MLSQAREVGGKMKDGECLKWEELEVFKVGSRLWLGDDSSVAVRFPESAI